MFDSFRCVSFDLFNVKIILYSIVLTFLHRACVQWNEHPISFAFGRTRRIALQIAFSKSKVTVVTLGWLGRIDNSA